MCGRFTMATPGQTIAEIFALPAVPQLSPRYNIAPTQLVAAVRAARDGARELLQLHWGLIPSWSKDPAIGSRMINARAETLAEKPAFRAPFRARRCLILADGFYEWRKLDGRKQPYFICIADRRPFAFAGLWERWAPPEQQPIESCTIITTAPNELVAPIHDRMPVILDEAAHRLWLDPAVRDEEKLQPLLQAFPPGDMVAYPVGLRVNSPANDDARCVTPLL